MTIRSYAQNHEDVLLSRAFPPGLTGFYIDIGANDPVENSITKHFYDLGWHGINVEPAQEPFQRLLAARPRDVCLNLGVSDEPGQLSFYELPPEAVGGSTFSAEQADWHHDHGLPADTRLVEVTTLAALCEQYVTGTIDFLSVDVEGHEAQVLAGADWERWRPRIVVVEATQPATTIPTHDQWEHILLEHRYLFAFFDGLNRYYVREEDSDLLPALSIPVNVTDDYIPFGYVKPMADLRQGFDTAHRQLAATRALNETLSAEVATMTEELSTLRARYERLDRALTRTRAELDEIRTAITAEGKPFEDLLREVGPLGLGLARRLSRLSGEFPHAATAAKKAARVARSVKNAS
jgi:FkbM family methyltransferase